MTVAEELEPVVEAVSDLAPGLLVHELAVVLKERQTQTSMFMGKITFQQHDDHLSSDI